MGRLRSAPCCMLYVVSAYNCMYCPPIQRLIKRATDVLQRHKWYQNIPLLTRNKYMSREVSQSGPFTNSPLLYVVCSKCIQLYVLCMYCPPFQRPIKRATDVLQRYNWYQNIPLLTRNKYMCHLQTSLPKKNDLA